MIRSLSSALMTALIWTTPSAWAVSAEDKNLISKIQQLAVQLKNTSNKIENCRTPNTPDCSFQSYCDSFADAGRGRNFYLYQNEEGRQIPNFTFTTYLEQAQECLGGADPANEVNDPFVYPEKLYDPKMAGGHDKIRENFTRYQNETKRIDRIFHETKDRTIEFLKSRRDPQNASEIDNMIARIQTLNIEIPKGGTRIAELASRGCEMPNAFYDPSTHQVLVCPQVMNMPDATLMSAIAHELAHSIDPCQSQKSYSKYQGVVSSNELLEKNPGQTVFKKIAMAKNPFKNVISCLQGSTSLGFQLPSLATLKNNAQEEFNESLQIKSERDEAEGEDGFSDRMQADFDDKIRTLESNYDEVKYCHEHTDRGVVQEAFSDWISSQVLKNKVSEIQDAGKARQFAFESQAIFMSLSCKRVQQTAVAYVRPLVKNKCPDLESRFDFVDHPDDETDSHPSTAGRVNKILFASPEIQRALGCQGEAQTKECK